MLCQVAAHAPLLLAVPGLTDSGLRTKHLVEFVDIFPTIVEAAGLPLLEVTPEILFFFIIHKLIFHEGLP